MCKWGTDAMVRLAHPMPVSGRTEIAVDACLAPLVQMLNNYGVRTIGCCCGHGQAEGNVLYEQDGQQHTLTIPRTTGRVAPPPLVCSVCGMGADNEQHLAACPDDCGAHDYRPAETLVDDPHLSCPACLYGNCRYHKKPAADPPPVQETSLVELRAMGQCWFMRPQQTTPCAVRHPDDEIRWCGVCLLVKYPRQNPHPFGDPPPVKDKA